MTRLYALLLVLAGLFFAPGAVLAQSRVVWSYDAMACVPAGAPIPTGLYDALAGGVRFREGKTGTVSLICPIQADLSGTHLRSLRLTYRDGDGPGPGNEAGGVSAALRRVTMRDGSVETVRNGEISSNKSSALNSGPTGWATDQSATSGNTLDVTLDFSKYFYYVQITLKRTDPSVAVGALGVHLTS